MRSLSNIFESLLLHFGGWIPDKLYLKLLFRAHMGYFMDFDNPRTFNEKLQWLKLYNRRPAYTDLVDKINVKEKIAGIIGEECIIPTIKVWDNISEITPEEIAKLPNKFVMKTNHSGGNSGVSICKDKNRWNAGEALQKMKTSLKADIYSRYREWPYKNVRKRVFVEEYLGDDITDYKFFCYDGYAESVMVAYDRQAGDTKFYFFDKDWNLKRYNVRGKEAPADFTKPKPKSIDRMFEIASELSKGFPFVRVDLYNIDGNIYFGEMTFYPASGLDPNLLPETDLHFGNLITPPKK